MYKTLIFITIVLLQSCGLSNKEIERSNWKLSDIRKNVVPPLSENRHHIDHISFGESRYYYLSGDTIYRDDTLYAVIIKRTARESTSIEIVQLDTKDTLRYVSK